MLRSIGSVTSVTIDGVVFPIHNISPDGDPLDQKCRQCGVQNNFFLVCEVSQLGWLADVHVILCVCKSCKNNQGWRYFFTPEETI